MFLEFMRPKWRTRCPCSWFCGSSRGLGGCLGCPARMLCAAVMQVCSCGGSCLDCGRVLEDHGILGGGPARSLFHRKEDTQPSSLTVQQGMPSGHSHEPGYISKNSWGTRDSNGVHTRGAVFCSLARDLRYELGFLSPKWHAYLVSQSSLPQGPGILGCLTASREEEPRGALCNDAART